MKRASVVILGGGFAGLACANALNSRRFDVTLIDRKPHFEFLPNIHELLSGVKKPAQLRLALGPAMRAVGHRFLRGEIESLDVGEQRVAIGGGRKLRADYLVVALGATDATFGVRGVLEHSLPFKSVDQCLAIRKRLQALAREKRAGRVVLIGSGLTGVEGLGEILRRYPQRDFQVTLVEAQKTLLPANPPAVAAFVERLSLEQGVEVLLGDAVNRLTAKTVWLKSGRRLRSDLTIWTGGPAPPPLLEESGLAEARGWAPVRSSLQHRDHETVFIAGDASEHETPIRRQAYHALDMGRCVAGNIRRHRRGRPPAVYRPSGKPTLLAFGDLSTVLINGNTALAGPALAAAKEAVFAAVMTQLDLRRGHERLGAAVTRGQQATQQLLWPSIRRWSELRRQSQLELLR